MESKNGGGAGVVLNVYDLTPVNNFLYWFGFGIFHSGIEVHGMEYGFGAHDLPVSGVFEVEPKSCPGYVYRRSVWMGRTEMSRFLFQPHPTKKMQVVAVSHVPTHPAFSDDDMDSTSSSGVDELDQQLLHSINVPTKLAKYLL